MAKKFDDIRHKGSPVDREAARREGRHVAQSNAIGQLRFVLGISQADLADRLGLTQSTVSRAESQPDPQLSSLVRYFEALGATLELTAVLPDGEQLAFDHPAGVGSAPTVAAAKLSTG